MELSLLVYVLSYYETPGVSSGPYQGRSTCGPLQSNDAQACKEGRHYLPCAPLYAPPDGRVLLPGFVTGQVRTTGSDPAWIRFRVQYDNSRGWQMSLRERKWSVELQRLGCCPGIAGVPYLQVSGMFDNIRGRLFVCYQLLSAKTTLLNLVRDFRSHSMLRSS